MNANDESEKAKTAHCSTCGQDYAEENLTQQNAPSHAGDGQQITVYKDAVGHTLKVIPSRKPLNGR